MSRMNGKKTHTHTYLHPIPIYCIFLYPYLLAETIRCMHASKVQISYRYFSCTGSTQKHIAQSSCGVHRTEAHALAHELICTHSYTRAHCTKPLRARTAQKQTLSHTNSSAHVPTHEHIEQNPCGLAPHRSTRPRT